MQYFDSHAHYDDEKFNNDRDEVIQSLKEANITKVISAGYSIKGSKAAIELSKKYPFIYATVGVSPNDIEETWEQDLKEVEKLLAENLESKVVAVGEIGLDYHYDTDKEIQKIVFKKQIDIANKYNLPIVIHTREAVQDTIQTIKENVVKKKGVFHCCPFNRELVKEALKLGFYISFSGTVTFKNAKNAEEIALMVPNDRFLIETDSPYLAPEPVRGTRNNSRNLKYIVEKLAEYKKITPEEIAKLSYENTKTLFKITN